VTLYCDLTCCQGCCSCTAVNRSIATQTKMACLHVHCTIITETDRTASEILPTTKMDQARPVTTCIWVRSSLGLQQLNPSNANKRIASRQARTATTFFEQEVASTVEVARQVAFVKQCSCSVYVRVACGITVCMCEFCIYDVRGLSMGGALCVYGWCIVCRSRFRQHTI